MRTKTRPTTNSERSGRSANCESIVAGSAADGTSVIPQNADSAFAPGTRVYVKRAGKHGFGTVCPGPAIPGYIRYRSDYNKGERIAKIVDVTAIGQKRRARH